MNRFFLLSALAIQLQASPFSWPTPLPFSEQKLKPQDFIQPTESGSIESGMWGYVREKGRRFHKGIDIRSFIKNQKGESIDPVYCAFDGTVSYINKNEKNSSYGRYVVVEHKNFDLPFYSLYAHLSTIDVRKGQKLEKGQRIGRMGRTSAYFKNNRFPKSRAHLHFETGIQLSEQKFQNWYNKTYPSNDPNFHDIWNGLNIIAWNPLKLLQATEEKNFSLSSFLKTFPTDLTVVVQTKTVPPFVLKYPSLLTKTIPDNLQGWQVELTWFGLPKAWTPLSQKPQKPFEFMSHSKILKTHHQQLVSFKNQTATPGPLLKKILFLLDLK